MIFKFTDSEVCINSYTDLPRNPSLRLISGFVYAIFGNIEFATHNFGINDLGEECDIFYDSNSSDFVNETATRFYHRNLTKPLNPTSHNLPLIKGVAIIFEGKNQVTNKGNFYGY